MPRKKSSTSALPRALGWLAAAALILFALGEAYRFSRSEQGQLVLARHLGLGDPKRTSELVGGRIRAALSRAGVPGDSVSARPARSSASLTKWRIGVEPGRSLLQLNYAVTRGLESEGAAVLSGEEAAEGGGGSMIRLTVGLPMRATHELDLVRLARRPGAPVETHGRLAIVLYGFGDDARSADSSFTLPVPFGVALAPGRPESRKVFRAAHAAGREVVLHLPLEPIDYPRVNPGPGTVLVTMSPARITSMLRHDIDQAAPIAAVANHMGSLATQDMTVMRSVFHELRRADLPFVHLMPAAGAVCKSLASEMGVPYSEPDMVLDAETRGRDTRALDGRWKQALQRARDRGACVVWIRATPLARRWLTAAFRPQRLEGVSLVPLSSIIRKPDPL
jgi:polysaccharide deacetylase 2 family uncharacterized protein YibQ